VNKHQNSSNTFIELMARMFLMHKSISILILVSLFGCASSGIVETGPNSYMLAKSEWGFTSGAVHTARLMQEASQFCNAKGKQLNVLSTNSNDVQFGKTPAAEVRFQCIDK
jgi:hypothetical protein